MTGGAHPFLFFFDQRLAVHPRCHVEAPPLWDGYDDSDLASARRTCPVRIGDVVRDGDGNEALVVAIAFHFIATGEEMDAYEIKPHFRLRRRGLAWSGDLRWASAADIAHGYANQGGPS